MSNKDSSESKSCNSSTALAALSAAALLLPAFSNTATADTAPENISLGYRASIYQEDSTDSSNIFSVGSTPSRSAERYDISVQQFHLLMPIGNQYSASIDLQTETLSGASPYFTTEDNGSPQLIMSGASINESRNDVAVTARHYNDRGNAGVSLSHSSENDYKSVAIAIDGARNMNKKHLTLSGGVSYSSDTLTPTQGRIETKILEGEKNSSSLFFGLSQIINKNFIVQSGLSFTALSGYLTDPYKFHDQRPSSKSQWTWTLGSRTYISHFDGAVHADFRYYSDSWGVNSHTLDLSWHQEVKEKYFVSPYLRYYSQEKANFFTHSADLNESYYADDFRLSSYDAVTIGLRLEKVVASWGFILSGERYVSDGDSDNTNTNNSNDKEAPGLISFYRVTMGVDYEFK
ncbi:MAG: DUF3570 domain-containing protein [Pseudomonadales bacterium]|nr:DUF3570 domain-containing protein [Pseudomonadales bacterium]